MNEKFDLTEEAFSSDDGKECSLCEWQTTKERRSHLINCWHLSEHESDVIYKG